MDELQQRAAKLMQLEELKEFRNQVRVEENPVKRNDRTAIRNGQGKDFEAPKFSKYTTLNTRRARILEEALNVELIPPPCKFPSHPRAD